MIMAEKKSKKSGTGRTELAKAIERVNASDALAKIAAESQVPRVLVWESKKGVWSRYAVKENDLKIGFAESFDGAMKKAKKLFPNSRVDHDTKMTDAIAKGLKKKFEATITAAGGTVQAGAKEVIKPAKGGKGPGKEPKEKDPATEEQVADLLEELRATTDPEEKKRIRRKLRSRGHYGGLGTGTGPKPKPTKAPAPKGKAKPDPDEDDDVDMDDDGDDDE